MPADLARVLLYLMYMIAFQRTVQFFAFLALPFLAVAQTLCPPPASFCGAGTTWDDQSQTCVVSFPSDTNLDGCVQLNDLLDLLMVYGACSDCGGGCELPNATSMCVEGICAVMSCDAGYIDFNGLAADGCEEEELPVFVCGDEVEHGGHAYETIEIGGQCWFGENLRATMYANGDDIPSTLTDNQWSNANDGATTIYGEEDGCSDYSPDIDSCDPVVALQEYGRLYNWHAVSDVRGLCPSGWHVPTQTEWQTLISGQGGTSSAGEALKSTYGWDYSGQGTNASGFSGMPGGKRQDGSGYYSSAGDKGIWWTSTPYSSLARHVELKFNSNGVTNSYSNRRVGYSVRCILDESP